MRAHGGALHSAHRDPHYPVQAACINVQKVARPLPDTCSTMCAAVSTMRRALQLGHTPRPVREYATQKPRPHISQRARANPCARMPHSKYLRISRSTYAGTGSM